MIHEIHVNYSETVKLFSTIDSCYNDIEIGRPGPPGKHSWFVVELIFCKRVNIMMLLLKQAEKIVTTDAAEGLRGNRSMRSQ